MADRCRPVTIVKTSNFWIGFVTGGIVSLLAAKALGWLVF